MSPCLNGLNAWPFKPNLFLFFLFQALSQCVFNCVGLSSKSLYLNADQKYEFHIFYSMECSVVHLGSQRISLSHIPVIQSYGSVSSFVNTVNANPG